MKPSCVPFSGEISGRTAVIIPIPMNEIEATSSTTSAAAKLACERFRSKNSATTPNSSIARIDAVDDRERAHPEEVDGPRERRHERVLDRPLPALPGDGLGEDLEDDPEVGPDDGADEQGRRHLVDVDLPAGRLDALRDEDDRQRVRDRPEEERDVPPDVALDEVDVALEDAGEADQLVAKNCRCAGHYFVLVLFALLVLEGLAGRGEERLLERLGVVAPLEVRRPAPGRAAGRRRGCRPGPRAPRPRRGRACRAGSSRRGSAGSRG